MTTPISRAAVLEILHTPAASDTFPDMIRRVEALEPDGRLDRLRSAAQFLVDRLESFEPDDNDAERMTRDFYGHVVPAHERLMQILAALEPVAQPETPIPGQFETMCLAIEDVITEAQAEIERLRRHLVATTDWMERTRASGDSGFWDWGADDVYTRARAALSTKGAADAQDGMGEG